MSATVSTQKAPPMFEFCKRKRWADLAVGELGDAILFILSPSYKILYCGSAITELLGWRDEEILDLDITDLVAQEDQATFRNNFTESVRGNTEMLSYVRFKPKSPFMTTNAQDLSQAVLFEIKGYPHFVPAMSLTQCQCFFAVAKPYPSRNMAMLNTFVDIKLENERLMQRLQVLRSRSNDPHPGGSFSSATTTLPRLTMDLGTRLPESGDVAYANYPTAGFEDIMMSSPSRPGLDHNPFAGTLYGGAHPASTIDGDAPEDTSKKRKLSKAQGGGHHVCVTCGRTDSPEWRKGPQGPKTLCNACGLRWAKATRSNVNNVPAE